ncbi:MAG: hypothetical protein KO318_02845 [Methanobacterium sp.]|jgi:hypothetical protein|uniref:Lipoprotein n=1 Tax=Methanobacterium subterraneum TaxID=59277 RepID=A0A2H4VP38_9EURY|nr:MULTISPECIES: hypothetical protein [Methanobacterium]AUB58872.1 hypothetical protein BK008_11490 [Methanobacterium sp. MZ-A1]AUB59836.1 hypothetical protein BK009_03595 [Methanobacterium subterraneum]MBW4257561.1 hypothetical protein [Methanobacterium sp. YSL]MCC7559358.1 hypothetical protein [Methanobacterium sp.]
MNTKNYQSIILILILGTVTVSGCTYLTGTTATINKTSTGGNFENEWVKFQYPPELVILDQSNSTQCKLEIYNSSTPNIENMVGEVFYCKSNRTDLSCFTKRKSITIADKPGIKIEDGLQVCSYVFLNSEYTDVKTMIVNFDAQKYRDAYQKVADTVVVKKISS